MDSSDFNNSRLIADNSDLSYDFNTRLFFPITTSENSYFAKLTTEFNSQELTSISLLGPCFNLPVNNEYEKERILKITKEFKDEIIELFSMKYGKPKISKRQLDPENPLDSFVLEQKFDKKIYTFNTSKKTIEISVQCCASFQTEIKYILTSEYDRIKTEILLGEKRRIENNQNAKNKTLEEI
ncbi:MAG: hypothetical protein COA67_01575 [Lutibacter sp.]|nr:MAG: hypothetical protein COA67_01575 [Lutibacter sp.]